AFAPMMFATPVNSYRSSEGRPGPAYWQNRADYAIQARLDVETKTLSGDETITYVNNSPGALDCLWLQLDQNAYRRDGRARAADEQGRSAFTDGFILEVVVIGDGHRYAHANYLVDDTRMRIGLPAPLAHGASVRIHVRYHYAIPGVFGGRTSWG